MDRRTFFRRAVSKTAETIVKEMDEKLEAEAVHWIRPPFALDELEFLLTCSRCGDCIAACPHQVIFPLEPRLGARVVNTPALDLLNKACHLCADWPCVTACADAALKIPLVEEGQSLPVPYLAKASINVEACLPYSGPECGACQGSCPQEGALQWQQEKPFISEAFCVGCGLCREACIVEPKAIELSSVVHYDVKYNKDSFPE